MLQSRTILTVVPKSSQSSQQFMSASSLASNHNADDSSGIIHTTTSSLTQSHAQTETPSTIVVEQKHVTHQQSVTSRNSATSPATSGDVCSSPIAVPMTTALVSAHNPNLLNHHQHQQHVHHHVNQSPGAPLLLSSSGSSIPTQAAGTLLAHNPQNVRFLIVQNTFFYMLSLIGHYIQANLPCNQRLYFSIGS